MVKTFFSVLIVIMFTSCMNNVYYFESTEFKNDIWLINDIVKQEVEIKDTTDVFNLYFIIRNTVNYGYSNLFMFFTTKYPNGQHSVDTLECILADNSGKWFGKGKGRIKESKILFKPNVRFPMVGNYQFGIKHGMRDDELKGLASVGILIEAVN